MRSHLTRFAVLGLAGVLGLSAIAPAWDSKASLPEDQAALFLRYMVARWGAEPVAWLLPVAQKMMPSFQELCPLLRMSMMVLGRKLQGMIS